MAKDFQPPFLRGYSSAQRDGNVETESFKKIEAESTGPRLDVHVISCHTTSYQEFWSCFLNIDKVSLIDLSRNITGSVP